MTPTVTKRGACILAWSAVILIPLTIWLGLGLPWHERIGQQDTEISIHEDQILRYRRLLVSVPRLRAELDQERSNEDVKAFYYDAETPALAGAELQRELQDMVRSAGARLINTQFLPAGAEERPPRVRIRTQLQGDTAALLDVLFQIEQARPFLFVDQMSVRSTSRGATAAQRNTRTRSRARRTPSRSKPPGQLTIRLDIFGYALGGTK